MTREQFIHEIRVQQEPLRRFLLALCNGDAFEADDIAQDACLKAWIHFDSFRGSSKMSTWLFRIAYNLWCDSKNKKTSCGLGNPEVVQLPSGSESDDRFKYQALYLAISSLSPGERAAVLLFYMEDKPIKEVSAIMGMPVGTIKSLLSRGRAKLKIKLK